MKQIIVALTFLVSVPSFSAEVYSVMNRESGRIIKELPNGKLKIKGSDSNEIFYSFPENVLEEVVDEAGFAKGQPVKYITGDRYYFGNISSVFMGKDGTIIKVLFDGLKYPTYLRIEDFEGRYSHLLTTGCKKSFRGAKVGDILEDNYGKKTVKYLFSDGTVVLEKKYFGGRSYHLTDLDAINYNADASCI